MRRLPVTLILPLLLMGLLAGCGLFAGPETPSQPATLPPAAQLVPTFTPTPIQPPAEQPPAAQPAEPQPTPTPELVVIEPPQPAEPEPEPPTPTPQVARITVTGNAVNVRRGPGTNYGIVGSVNQGMQFDVIARNPAGDWFQFCCVNGEEGWIFNQLVTVENSQLVAVAQNIPAPPPPPTPVPAAPPPPAPAPQPEQPAPAPPPASDPCASVPEGCKFRVTGGPSSLNNGGLELKLQFFFIHSGVDGGQPQGSYFVWLEKDGVKLPVPDSIRSIALNRSEGPQGPYNYEYKIGVSDLPGNNVAGTYVGWVIDGNGNRDSQNWSFTLPDGHGEVWMQFDQN
jgi:SH3-like domain-containing protein